MAGPLDGVRVLAIERALAGPFGSMILGDLGAEVIMIEPPGGEPKRWLAGSKGDVASFLYCNRNKKSVVLDLLTETGRKALYDLVKISDVVWDNNRAGVMGRLKADYNTLKKINPRIICCSITGFGSSGPYANRPAYDIISQGMSGIILQTGYPSGPPTKPAPPLGDLSSSLYAAIGVISALRHRDRTGDGQKVEVNLLSTAMALLSLHYADYFQNGIVPLPVGTGHIGSAPFGVYKTKDGWIAIAISVDSAWPVLAGILGIEWAVNDPRFATRKDRLKNREELDAIITGVTGQKDSQTWLELLDANDLPAGPVYNLDQAIEDPQVKHNDIILTMEHPQSGQIKLIGNPIKMPVIQTEEFTPPPTLGQHSHHVFSELLHYSDEEVRKLEEEQEKHFAEFQKRYRKG